MNCMSNWKYFCVFFLIGLLVLPALGICAALFDAAERVRTGTTFSPGEKFAIAATFTGIGWAFAGAVAYYFPTHVKLTDTLDIHYLFRTRSMSRNQVAWAGAREMEVDVSTRQSPVPIMVKETLFGIEFTDGGRTFLFVSPDAAQEFQATAQEWLQRSTVIPEDGRSLREFYPDPVLRYRIHRAFTHDFLPQHIHNDPYAFFSLLYDKNSPIEPTRFIQSHWSAVFEPAAGLKPEQADPSRGGVERRVSDLNMSIQELGGYASALIEMPAPEGPLGAYFVCVVLLEAAHGTGSWPRDVQARVFTLEVELSGPASQTGLVCEWTSKGVHQNHSLLIPAKREAMLQAVTAVLQSSAPPVV